MPVKLLPLAIAVGNGSPGTIRESASGATKT